MSVFPSSVDTDAAKNASHVPVVQPMSRRTLLRFVGAGVAGTGAAVVLAPVPASADTAVAGSGGPAASDADVVHRGGPPGEVITSAKDFNGPIRRGCGPEWDVTNGTWGVVPDLPGAAAANGKGLKALLAVAGPGDHIVFPNGETFVPAASITNPRTARALTFEGKGKLASWVTPVRDFTGAVFDLSPTGPPPRGARGAYGGGVNNLGINLGYAPTSRGIHLGTWSGWAELCDLWIQGGNTSVINEGTNNWIENLRLFDAEQFIAVNGDTGLELTIRDVQTARHSPGTTLRVLTVTATTTAAAGGALYLSDFRHSSGTSGGIQTVAGILVTSLAATNRSIPVFADKVILDNIVGGGPGLELNNVADIHFDNGWINTGTAAGGPCVRVTGGANLKFAGNDYYGGGSGTDTYKTYDFTGGTTTGFVSVGNTCHTNWVYYLPPTAGPTAMICDDLIPGAVTGMNISNDMTQFLTATTTPRFGTQLLSDKTILNNPVLPDGRAAGFAQLHNGTVTINTPLADAAHTIIHKSYRTINGTPGILVDGGITTGTSITINSVTPNGTPNPSDNSTIEWMVVARG